MGSLLKLAVGALLKTLNRPASLGLPSPEKPITRVCPECQSLQRADSECINCKAPALQYIDLSSYFKGHDLNPLYKAELTPQLVDNAKDLLLRVNRALETICRDLPGFTPVVNSGWRPRAYNASIGGAANSKHIVCLAVDLDDSQGELGRYLQLNVPLLERFDLAIEEPSYTPGWCHIQHGAPPSGHRIFVPFARPK